MKIVWLRRDVEHLVYRCRDGAGQLLYIGATNSYSQRMSQHRARTPWWPDVASISTEPYPDRAAALVAELAAIGAEHPVHNVRGVTP
jgi:hypothetical protein